VLAGVLVFILAQLAIAWQIIRAVKANAVESFRYD
jgi:hypothetical protein